MRARHDLLLTLGVVASLAGCSRSSGSGGAAASASAAGVSSTSTPAPLATSTSAPVASIVPPAVLPAGWSWTPVPDLDPPGPLVELPPGYLSSGGDPVHLPDRLAAGRFTDRDPAAVPATLRVVTWNVEFGKDSAGVLQQLTLDPSLAGADLLLLTEVPRADTESVPAGVDLARELARALRMDYVFAVEWDRREVTPGGGEHGSAILSKYPLGNARHLRHRPFFPYHATTGRLGGRHSLGVDVLVGGRPLAVWVVHLDTRDTGGVRALQAAEVLADAARPGRPVAQVIGGDWNTWNCLPAGWDSANTTAVEPVIRQALAAGFVDTTPAFRSFTQLGLGFYPQRLDWIFARGVSFLPDGRAEPTGSSDHLPLRATLLPP
jgi:endonuclease/exonuclease/phosphatase family metal-dependent hydrolase